MKVGIIQSNFLPWRGYFDFIREVDFFILEDDVQYTKGDWRNRNKIKTPRGTEWITVPVKYKKTEQLIQDTPIDYSAAWGRKMLNRIRESYRSAPFFDRYFSELSNLLEEPAASISALNLSLIQWVCRHLEIHTPIGFSQDYHPRGTKTERVLSILQQTRADTYLSGPSGRNYILPELFEQAGIRLEYKQYEYPEYEQLYPPFDPGVSILDLLFMKGVEAGFFLEASKERQAK
jgi:hypothetical protein